MAATRLSTVTHGAPRTAIPTRCVCLMYRPSPLCGTAPTVRATGNPAIGRAASPPSIGRMTNTSLNHDGAELPKQSWTADSAETGCDQTVVGCPNTDLGPRSEDQFVEDMLDVRRDRPVGD